MPREKDDDGLFVPMIELNYAQPMWPSVAHLLDDSSKVLQFCTSSRVTWTLSFIWSLSRLTLVYVWTNWKGLFTWIELLSCWPSLVPGLTCLQKELQLLTKPTITAYPPNKSMLLLARPNIKSYPSVESIENVCWAKHQSQSISKGEYYLLCRAWGLLFRWSSTKLFVLENGLVLLPHQDRVKLHFQIQWSCRLCNYDFLSVSTNAF